MKLFVRRLIALWHGQPGTVHTTALSGEYQRWIDVANQKRANEDFSVHFVFE